MVRNLRKILGTKTSDEKSAVGLPGRVAFKISSAWAVPQQGKQAER